MNLKEYDQYWQRERTEAEWETGRGEFELYRYWNDIAPPEHQLLYIGITHSFNQRDSSHWRSSRWRLQATRVDIQIYPSRAMAMLAEYEAIVAEVPVYNTVHTDVAKWQAIHGEWLAFVENRHRLSESDARCAQAVGRAIFGKAS